MYVLQVIEKSRSKAGAYHTNLIDGDQMLYEVIGKRFYEAVELRGAARFNAKVKSTSDKVTRLNFISNLNFIEAPSDNPVDIMRDKELDEKLRLIIDYDVAIELCEQGHQFIAEIPSELFEGRNIYVFARSGELDAKLLGYDSTTYYV